VAPNPRYRDFTTQTFEYGAQRKFTKREIVMHFKVGPTVIAWDCMRRGVVQKAKAPELVTKKELCGLEVPKFTRRSRELVWDNYGCQVFPDPDKSS
jgi:hypothetical protein